MKKTLFLMTVTIAAMAVGIGTAMAGGELSAIAPMPEPTSLILVAAGLLGLAGISRRKRK